MQAVTVLTDSQRYKLDASNDELFYSQPRFVHHLDGGFRSRLTRLYRQKIPPCALVLDLMSSWVSHLPEDVSYDRVIGHGLNEEELAANPRLNNYWVQNLNKDQSIPLNDSSVDITLIVAGWQYLQYPEHVASELFRITRPRGQVLVAFSNRMFPSKAPQIWFDSSDSERLDYIVEVLLAQGWPNPEIIAEDTRADGVSGFFGGKGDPFFAVVAQKPWH